MLAKDVGMNVLLVDVVIFRDAGTQAGGIQDRTGADNVALGQAGDLVEDIGQGYRRGWTR